MDENKLFKSLWDLLVPPNGKAETAQGEVCSCAVDWVKRNPNPEDIPLLDTDYSR